MNSQAFASMLVYERRKAEYIRDVSKVNSVLLAQFQGDVGSSSGSAGDGAQSPADKPLLIPIDKYLR